MENIFNRRPSAVKLKKLPLIASNSSSVLDMPTGRGTSLFSGQKRKVKRPSIVR